MLNLNRPKIAVLVILGSLPVLFFFQNCGQAGAINAVSSVLPSVAPSKTTDSLIVVPKENVNTGNTSTNDIQLDDPPLSIEENENTSLNSPDISIEGCDQIAISDVLLNILSVSTNSDQPNRASFEIVDTDKSISLDKLTLKVKALRNENIKEVFLLLNSKGNKILSMQNVAMDLKIPSSEQAGVKVKLDQEQSLVTDQVYSLVLNLIPESQLITNNKKCIFKPVIHSATLKTL